MCVSGVQNVLRGILTCPVTAAFDDFSALSHTRTLPLSPAVWVLLPRGQRQRNTLSVPRFVSSLCRPKHFAPTPFLPLFSPSPPEETAAV